MDGAYDYEVIGLLEELEVSETLNEFQVIGSSDVVERYVDVNDTAGDASADPDNATTTIIAAAAAAATTTTCTNRPTSATTTTTSSVIATTGA